MKTTEAIEYFKTKAALARAIGVERQSISAWGDVVPFTRQLQIERLTEGKLKAMSVDEFVGMK